MLFFHFWSYISCSDDEDIGADTGITEENKAVLEKVRMNTRQEFLQQQQQQQQQQQEGAIGGGAVGGGAMGGGTGGGRGSTASTPISSSSVRASDRLMRELRDIYRSQYFKDGVCVCVCVCVCMCVCVHVCAVQV